MKIWKKKIQTLEESLSLASKTKETSTVEKLRKEVECHTKEFGKFLESSKTLTTLLKFHQHPLDKSSLGFEKGTTFSKSQPILHKFDFYGKSGHSKFKCIYKKKQMCKGTNHVGPKKIWVPKSQIVLVANSLARNRMGFQLVPR